jgi:predicted nucleotidyltransferase
VPRERGWTPTVASRIKLDEAQIAAFCKRWQIERLELFGSVLRDDFRPGSDADLLVTFRPGARWSLLDHVAMEEELGQLIGRPVDLVTRRSVGRSSNPIRRQSILASAVPLFTAGAAAPVNGHSRTVSTGS